MTRAFATYIAPSLVIQAVMIGGGFATGRELVEFFLAMGAPAAFLAMGLTTLLFSACATVAFVLASQHRTYDYNAFCRLFLGPLRFLFEVGYVAGLMLGLAIVSAAAGELLFTLAGAPHWLGAGLYMLIVGSIVYFGNTALERFASIWAIVFYAVYGSLLALTLYKFSGASLVAFSEPLAPAQTIAWNGLSYAAYNIPLIAILVFIARNFKTRRQAIVSGLLCGPVVMAPAAAFLLAMTPFAVDVLDAPLPILTVLDNIGWASFSLVSQIVVLGALLTTGAGLVHGLNERLANTAIARFGGAPRLFRPIVAVSLMIAATYLAVSIGLIDLIARGYRYAALFYIVVLIVPLLTVGAWRAFGKGRTPDRRTAQS